MDRIRGYVGRFGGFERDARVFLGTALVAGAALSLYWIDFNLYLASIGLTPATIGLIATAGSVASTLVAFPASALSDRIGRRLVLAGGLALMLVALVGFLFVREPLAIGLLAAAYGAGQQVFFVVQNPFLMEHSRSEHRSELFAVAFAIENVTNIVAAIAGGAIAVLVARWRGFDPEGPEAYRVLLVLMCGLMALAMVAIFVVSDDRPGRRSVPTSARCGRRAGRVPGRPVPAPARPPLRAGRPGPSDVHPAARPGLPHLARGRPGHPVPQPVRRTEVRARPGDAQRGLRGHGPGDGLRDPAPARPRRGGWARSARSCSSRG